MPLYYDWHAMGALVSTSIWMTCNPIWMVYLTYYDISCSWQYWLLAATSWFISAYCSGPLFGSFYYVWREPPDLQLDNAAPANGNETQLQRGRLRHLPNLPGMLTDVFQCLPRVVLDACQLLSRLFRDAVEDARTTLPLHPMRVDLSPSTPLVEYVASIVNVGSVTGQFFTSLRRCDLPYFRNAAIDLCVMDATYARTTTDMISAFVRWLDVDERNVRFTSIRV
ncbi:hypothetical protein AAVH_20482 [Aphelenchoides avenae]|nr:hypothetical protein AAVH_20482 [Aphelenchus avenae]